uniref:BBSome-interacting protein 1 n=1 Tax=Parastrongyloides trichosuri TaxID=131310 RepID=A0A0N4ZNH0_PARTI
MNEEDSLKIQVTLKNGILFPSEYFQPVFCKPKLIPLKSLTLEKLEKMQQEALEKLEEIDKNNKFNNIENNKEITNDNMNDNKKTDVWSADD